MLTFLSQIITNYFIFFIGVSGILFNKRNILIILMSIELMLLGVNLNFLMFSIYLDDIYGQLFSLFILTVGASEAAIGLAILILYFRIRGNIEIFQSPSLKN
jgi:NADH-quinone oxidoreductase subunit K